MCTDQQYRGEDWMIDRAQYLGCRRLVVLVTVDNPTFADKVDPERNKKTYKIPPGESDETRLIAIRAAKNPLLEAARPLLRAQADMPDDLECHEGDLLRHLLKEEVRAFERLCEQANIRRDHMIGARYCLCTALDEAAMQTAWGKGGNSGVEWSKNGLATAFLEDRQGGDRVYLLIGRLMTEPQEHLNLLEVIYRVLSLGFEGRYRYEANGSRKHDAVRQRLYDEIMSRRPPVPVALSPHGLSDVKPKRVTFYDFPVWITVVVLSTVLLAMFGYSKYDMMRRSAAVQKQIANIGRMMPPRCFADSAPEGSAEKRNCGRHGQRR